MVSFSELLKTEQQNSSTGEEVFQFNDSTNTLTFTKSVSIYSSTYLYASTRERESITILEQYIFPQFQKTLTSNAFLGDESSPNQGQQPQETITSTSSSNVSGEVIRVLVLESGSYLSDEVWCKLLKSIQSSSALEEFHYGEMSITSKPLIKDFQQVISRYMKSAPLPSVTNQQSVTPTEDNDALPLIRFVNVLKNNLYLCSFVNGYLDLRYRMINADLIRFVIEDLSSNNNSIQSENTEIGEQRVESSINLIKKLHLSDLRLNMWDSYHKSTSDTDKQEVLVNLAKVLGSTRSLEELHFTTEDICNNVDPTTGEPIILKYLQQNSTLKVLGFHGREEKNHILGADTIAKILVPSPDNATNIKEFHFFASNADQLKILAEAIKLNRSIEKLRLTWIHIDDSGVEAVAKVVGQHPTIKEWDFSGAITKVQGALQFGKYMKNNPILEVINFNRAFLCCYDNYWKGARGVVATMLQRMENSQRHRGLSAFLNAAATLPKLRELHLEENRIHEKGALMLVRWLKRYPYLRVLHLKKNNIGELAARKFEDHFQRNKGQMEVFSISSFTISSIDYDTYNNRIALLLLHSS